MSDLLPTATQAREKLALAEAEKASEALRRKEKADAEKKALIDQLSKPSGVSEEEAFKRAAAIINRAIGEGLTEVEVLRFPNGLCTDHGRAINNREPGWESDSHRPAQGDVRLLAQAPAAARLQSEGPGRGFSERDSR